MTPPKSTQAAGTTSKSKSKSAAAKKPAAKAASARKPAAAESATVAPAAIAKQSAPQADYWSRGFAIIAIVVSVISLAVAAMPYYAPRHAAATLTTDRLLILGVAQLRPVLATSRPFDAELATLYKLIPRNASSEVREILAYIAPAAKSGIPTKAQLRRRFVNVSQMIFVEEVIPPKDVWYERLKVFVHSVEPILSGKNQPLLAVKAAEARLRVGDLGGAVEEMEKLTGDSADAAADWLVAAHRRLAADKALDILDALALNQ
jgi:hypothetical protein